MPVNCVITLSNGNSSKHEIVIKVFFDLLECRHLRIHLRNCGLRESYALPSVQYDLSGSLWGGGFDAQQERKRKNLDFLRASGFEHSDHELYKQMEEEHTRELAKHLLDVELFPGLER